MNTQAIAPVRDPFRRGAPGLNEDEGVESGAVTLEALRVIVEEEAARHRRYLRGWGLVRIGCEDPRGVVWLEEALTTETRRTDRWARLPDGTYAVLCIEAGLDACAAVAKRLQLVAQDVGACRGQLFAYPAGIAAAGNVRAAAEDVWARAAFAYNRSRAAGGEYVHLPEHH